MKLLPQVTDTSKQIIKEVFEILIEVLRLMYVQINSDITYPVNVTYIYA